MKNYFIKNKVLISVSMVLIILGFVSVSNVNKELKQIEKSYYNTATDCKENPDNYNKEYCSNFSGNFIKIDTFTVFFNIIGFQDIRLLQVFAPLFVIIVSIWDFNMRLKSGFFKNILTRKKYIDYIKEETAKAWKYSLLIPVFLLFLFICSLILSGNFNINETIKEYPGYLFISSNLVKILPYFMFTFFATLIMHGIFWVNIGLIVSKKSRSLVGAIVASFLVFITMMIVSEVFVGGLLFNQILGIKVATFYFNFASIWTYEGISKIYLVLLYGVFLATSSSYFVYMTYKNEEEVVILNEG